MNRPSIFVVQGGKKRRVALSPIRRSDSNPETIADEIRTLNAFGKSGIFTYNEYSGPLAECFALHLDTVLETIVTFTARPESFYLYYCVKGISRLSVENEKEYLIGQSQFHWFFPFESHRLSFSFSPQKKDEYVILGVKVELDKESESPFNRRFVAYLKNELSAVSRGSFKMTAFTSTLSLKSYLFRLSKALGSKQQEHVEISAYFPIVLLEILNQIKQPDLSGLDGDSNAEEDLAFFIAESIILEIDERLDLDELALQNKIKLKKLKGIFKKYVGMPMSAFRISIRMEKAKQLLVDTSLRIQDISLQVGYPNPANFAKLFKQKVGLSASEIRKDGGNRSKRKPMRRE